MTHLVAKLERKPVVVVVFGNMAHGKDTLADLLAANLPGARRMAFADPLKEAAESLLGIPRSVSYGSQADKLTHVAYGRTARQWLQWLGTEVGRQQVHADLWVHRAGDKVLGLGAPYVVVSDGRFQNELTGLREYLGDRAVVVNVLVYRPGLPEPVGREPTRFWRFMARMGRWVGRDVRFIHPSELEVFKLRKRALKGDPLFDHTVLNNSDLHTLGQRAKQVAQKVQRM